MIRFWAKCYHVKVRCQGHKKGPHLAKSTPDPDPRPPPPPPPDYSDPNISLFIMMDYVHLHCNEKLHIAAVAFYFVTVL